MNNKFWAPGSSSLVLGTDLIDRQTVFLSERYYLNLVDLQYIERHDCM